MKCELDVDFMSLIKFKFVITQEQKIAHFIIAGLG